MQVNNKKMVTTDDFDEAVKQANMSSDRVLWIQAKTQSGLNKPFVIELDDDAQTPKSKK